MGRGSVHLPRHPGAGSSIAYGSGGARLSLHWMHAWPQALIHPRPLHHLRGCWASLRHRAVTCTITSTTKCRSSASHRSGCLRSTSVFIGALLLPLLNHGGHACDLYLLAAYFIMLLAATILVVALRMHDLLSSSLARWCSSRLLFIRTRRRRMVNLAVCGYDSGGGCCT